MRRDSPRLISWRTRWRVFEYVRNSLWIVPGGFVIVAIALGWGLPTVDEHTSVTIGISFNADAARAMLGAIAGGMITFTGFVFSILLLAVQFGSSQFSPRLLRRFLRDPTTKAALGIFMATFTYALLVVRVVGTGTQASFVPNNSISVALLLLALSMLIFLRLINRTTQGLRVAAVLYDLGRDARRVITRWYPDPATGDEADEPQEPDPPEPWRTVAYDASPGILQSVDVKHLLRLGVTEDVVIELVPRFGDLLDRGAPLFRVYGDRGTIDDVALRKMVATGDERTLRQDPAFAFRLLADISAKALSPGVNDPTTSVQALDQIELLLRLVGSRRLASNVHRDERGRVRFWFQAPSWGDYVSLAIDETRQYGEGSIQVTRRLRALLEDLRRAVPEPRRAVVDTELARVAASAARAFADPDDQLAAAARDRQGLGATEAVDGASGG